MTDLSHKLAELYLMFMREILHAFSDINEVLPGLDGLKKTSSEDILSNQVVELSYIHIFEFHQQVHKFIRCKARHIWFAIDWSSFEHRLRLIFQKLDSYCDTPDKEAAATSALPLTTSNLTLPPPPVRGVFQLRT